MESNHNPGYSNTILQHLNPVDTRMPIVERVRLGMISNERLMSILVGSLPEENTKKTIKRILVSIELNTPRKHRKNLQVSNPSSNPLSLNMGHGPTKRSFVIPKLDDKIDIMYEKKNRSQPQLSSLYKGFS